MFAWLVTGRWTGGGKSAEDTFIVLTKTREQEEATARAHQELVSLAATACGALKGELSVELTEIRELERVATVRPLAGL